MDVHDIVTPKTGNQAAPIGTHKPSNHHLNITSPAGAWETCRPSPTNPRPTLPHNLTQHTVFSCFWPISIEIKHRLFTVLTRTSTVYRYGWIYDNFGAWNYESQWSEYDGLVTLLSPYSHAPLRIVTLLLVFPPFFYHRSCICSVSPSLISHVPPQSCISFHILPTSFLRYIVFCLLFSLLSFLNILSHSYSRFIVMILIFLLFFSLGFLFLSSLVWFCC